ncbi:hypothetical protein [Desulfobacula sp.]|uniref:hypothetical protein n=1 Tax=Desulfobacula sp. TaxID=2593537 RepID=UPI0026339576|nr:hypothetical protein [Desulfobacula sp.]
MAKNPVKPALQGDFSSQCGFYAIGNVMSLLFPNINKNKVFESIWDYYIETYGDAEGVLYGIYRDRVNKILCNVIIELGLPLTVYRPWWSKKATSIDEFLNKIRNALNSQDSAIILGYEHGLEDDNGYYSHWTIIKKITEKSLVTFDSDRGNSRIQLQRCDLWNKEYSRKRPYRLSTTDTFIISKTYEEKT